MVRRPNTRTHIDGYAMADRAVRALSAQRDGMPEEFLVGGFYWPERGRMTREDVAREGLRIARFFDVEEFRVLTRGPFLLELTRSGIPWHVFVKAEAQREWKSGPREGQPITQEDVAAFFAEHLERDGGRGLTVAAVNTHFGYPPPQTEKAGGREKTGQIGLGL